MKIGIIGTGVVGRAVAVRLHELGHDVLIGTRDPEATLARTTVDARGIVPFAQWQLEHDEIRLGTFPEAAAYGQIVVNATAGAVSLAALRAAGAEALAGKTLLDIALPLVRHEGLAPTLSVSSTHSLAEQIQEAFPATHVVKSLVTVQADVMVDPSRIPGETAVFVSGDDPMAKRAVTDLLREFGWTEDATIDLGPLRSARGQEMYPGLLFELARTFGSFDFNIALHRA